MKPLPVLATLFAVLATTLVHADIYQWEYIDPLHPELGKQQSSTLAPDGAGIEPGVGLDASGRNLTQAYLANFNLAEADFTRTNLSDAYANGSNLRDALLWETDLMHADLNHADLTSARLWDTNLTFAALRDARLTSAILQNAHLAHADLSRADLTSANLRDANFRDANLTGANFTKAVELSGDFTNADFTDAIVREASFCNAGRASGITQSQLYSTASHKMRDLSGVHFFSSDLRGWDFTGQDLFNSRIDTDSNLAGANFSGARLASADLTGVVLDNASFRGADLTGALLGAEFCVLCKSSLRGADFRSANLRSANLKSADLSGANFTDADIRGAMFSTYESYDPYIDNGFTTAQLYSTASYKLGDLTGMQLVGDISGWNFSGQDLARCFFIGISETGDNLANIDFSGVNLMGGQLELAASIDTILTGADARGARQLQIGSANTHNLVDQEGHVEELQVAADETFRLWDFLPTLIPRYPNGIPILVEDAMSIDHSGTLRAVFEDDQWGSTITFEPGIPVSLDGTLELLLDDDAHPASLVGTTYMLFDWTGVEPTGKFDAIEFHPGTTWDTSSLYATGEVTLIGAVPEPAALTLGCIAITLAGALSERR